jgi:methyltransferase (TIGR00027 family)
MNEIPIQNVSDTAFMVAMYRAMEGERPDALFHDPLSAKLAGEHGRKILQGLARGHSLTLKMRARLMAWTMAIRTHIIDELLLACVNEGADAVVNLGAGLDTRPYRMQLPTTLHWIEVDYPPIIELKNSRLADERPRCQLQRIALDLADLPARSSLFRELSARHQRMVVLTEGVIPYLSVEAVAQLAQDLHALVAVRWWITDYISASTLRYRRRRSVRRQMQHAPFLFEPPDYFQFFREHGWREQSAHYLWEEGERLRRPMPVPGWARLLWLLRNVLKTPAQRLARRRFMGYVLFEPVR